ncbi:hypothetical protein RA276_32215, partial [Pseudomonas syringae pv. tagetis]|uniref:hypothetical protein n=1 Tax=Pseudomonas syringae group genomosp. 7 TaxID=251699 RepID=UPI00376F688E
QVRDHSDSDEEHRACFAGVHCFRVFIAEELCFFDVVFFLILDAADDDLVNAWMILHGRIVVSQSGGVD